MHRTKSHPLTPQVASASILLLWSQLTGLLTHIEQDDGLPDDRPMKDGITSYRESPTCLSQSITSSSEAAEGSGQQPSFPIEDKMKDGSPSQRHSASLQRSLLSAFQKLEGKVAEKAQECPLDRGAESDDTSKEPPDASFVSSILKPSIVDLLIEFLDELRELRGNTPQGSLGDDSTRHETLELCSSSTDRVGQLDSETGSEDEGRVPLLDTVDSRCLMAHIFNSSLFNYCLDRMVEARDRFRSKTQTRSDFCSFIPGPPTLGLQGFGIQGRYSPVNASEPSTEIQHPSKAIDLSDQAKRIARLLEQKRGREAELREQARARRNLKVQVSAHMSLFRALADLASFPIEIVNDAESDDTDRQVTSSTELNETETDTSTVDKPRNVPAAMHRLPRTVRGRRPRVAVPNVPAEIAAVLKKEKVHGLQIKRAVEAVVALKAEQLDLIVANLSLETMLQHERAAKAESRLAHTRQLSQRPSHILRPPTIQESPTESDYIPSSQSRYRNSGGMQYNHMDPMVRPQRGVSPILRPLQSSPHLTGSDYHMPTRSFIPGMEDSGPMSPPYYRYSIGSAPFAPPPHRPLPASRWSPDPSLYHRRPNERVPSLRYPAPTPSTHVHGPRPHAAPPFPSFASGPFVHRHDGEGFGTGEVDVMSECEPTHIPLSPHVDGGHHRCYPHQHSSRDHMPMSSSAARMLQQQHQFNFNRSRSFVTYSHSDVPRELCQSMSVMLNDGGDLTPAHTLVEGESRGVERIDTNHSTRGSLATQSRKSTKGGTLAASWSNVKKTFLHVTRGGGNHKKETDTKLS